MRRPALSRARLAVLVVVAFVVAVVIWTVITALAAEHDLLAARQDVHRLTTGAAPDRAALEASLRRDLKRVDHARGLLGQPGPVVFGWVPILGRNVTAERTVADASAAALQAGLTLSTSTRGLSNGQGGVDLGRLQEASDALNQADAALRPALAKLRSQPVAWTLPAVSNGVRQARDQLLQLGPQVARSAAGLHALVGVLGGDGRRTVAVVLMNNAELRGAGGLPSAYATGTIDAGQLQLAPFKDVNTVAQAPAHAVRVDAPADYHATYGPYLADTTLWKNTTMSPLDPESAQVIAETTALSLHVHPDVVVLCDVPAASGIISATGPVTIDGESVTGDELTRRLLVDAYGDGSLSEAKQQKRRQVLDEAATEAFARLRHGATSTPALLRAIANAVSGRHLVIWSARPEEQQALVAAGAAGDVDATGHDIAMVVANNLGDSPSTGNKLDYYVHREVTVDVTLHAHRADVVETVVMRNAAPAGLGPYVEGVAHPGMLNELLSFATASDATLTSFTRDGQPVDVAVDESAGGKRLTTVATLAAGSTTTYTLAYSTAIRHSVYELLLVPQALAQPAQLHVSVRAVDAELGVVSGGPQPRNARIDMTTNWDDVQDLVIPVHSLHGLRALFHDIAHFWSHRVGS